MQTETVASVLTEIARTASETLELQEVFNRVAASVRRLIPFDNIVVIRIVDGEYAVAHATSVECRKDEEGCVGPTPLTSWSPRIRPRCGAMPQVGDAEAELDSAFPLDAKLLRHGVRSALWEPFCSGETFLGGVFLSAFRKQAFSGEHQESLRPIAALLGSAVEHWRIWDTERRRRERLDRLEVLLGDLADSLDVRNVFGKMSEALQ